MTQPAIPSARPANPLEWQSRLLVGIFVPFAAFSVYVFTVHYRAWWLHPAPSYFFLPIFCLLFAAFVYQSRAATFPAALTGGLFCYVLVSGTQSRIDHPLRSCLAPLVVLFLLTFAATRWRRARKLVLGVAESKRGRRTSQVVANLGIACTNLPIYFALILSIAAPVQIGEFGERFHLRFVSIALAMPLAALAEATADTLSSEIGQALQGKNRWGRTVMLTTLRPIAAGTDGGISLAGSLAGILGAAAVALTGMAAMHLPLQFAAIAFAAAIFGLFFDSLLGATLERRNLINNDVVNFLSTLAAAVAAALLLEI